MPIILLKYLKKAIRDNYPDSGLKIQEATYKVNRYYELFFTHEYPINKELKEQMLKVLKEDNNAYHSILIELAKMRAETKFFESKDNMEFVTVLLIEILKKILAIIPVLLGVFVDIWSMLYGVIIINFVYFFINAHYSGSMINYTSFDQLKDIMPSILISAISAIVMWLISFIEAPIYMVFATQLIVGSIVALSLHELFRFSEYVEIKEIFKHYISKFID